MATRKTASPAKKTAPAKNGRATKAENRWAHVQLPEGFVPVQNGDFGEDWAYEDDPILVGTVTGEVRVIEVKRGKNKESTRVVGVADESTGVIYSVWESASLRPWFDAIGDGMRVAIAFQGYRDVGKPAPMKVFLGSIEPPAEGEAKPKKARARA